MKFIGLKNLKKQSDIRFNENVEFLNCETKENNDGGLAYKMQIDAE